MSKFLVLTLVVVLGSCAGVAQVPNTAATRTVITFGSCAQETKPQPILQQVADLRPDFFIYLGDNIYGDTYDMNVLRAKYAQLAAKPEYQALRRSTTVLATWDDHDFGWNDSGRHYPFAKESKDIFSTSFKNPPIPSEENATGFTLPTYIIMVAKTSRSSSSIPARSATICATTAANSTTKARYFYPLDYFPHQTTDSTLLGEQQWQWLESELRRPADVRIIGSSTQFGIEFNGYEAWANFPHEQQRMLDLIQKTRANGVLFISGDVHYAEISKIQPSGGYPIYDVTSSGITSTWHFATPNAHRIEGPVMENHFGIITIDWKPADPLIRMEVIDVSGNSRIEYTVPLSQLRF
jgi:alkaline phosphatase D